MMASPANGGGTNKSEAFAPVARAASLHGIEHRPAFVLRPALPGVTPPTICVP